MLPDAEFDYLKPGDQGECCGKSVSEHIKVITVLYVVEYTMAKFGSVTNINHRDGG